jgi:hypothetical protein
MATKVSRRAEQVWKRLGTWYGARMAEQYGAHPPEDWIELIDHTDPERLEQALASIRREHVAHPPTLGQFEAAIPAKRVRHENKSVPEQLCEFVVRYRHTCEHQRARPWTYFGPVVEYPPQPKAGRTTPISNPEPRGVVVPACSLCGLSSLRVTTKDLAYPPQQEPIPNPVPNSAGHPAPATTPDIGKEDAALLDEFFDASA